MMERGNQPAGGPGGAGPGGSVEGPLVDPGATSAGSGPSTVANPGGISTGAGAGAEVGWEMVDWNRIEWRDDGSAKIPFVDDNGDVVVWGEATVGTFAEGLETPPGPGESRVLEIDGHWFDAHSDGSLTPLQD